MFPKDFQKIWHSLQQKELAPVYWLEGQESFYIDAIADHLEENVLSAAQRDFDQWVLYGRDTQLFEVLQQARQFPVSGKKKLVLVKEAQDVSQLGTKEGTRMLSDYLAQPAPFTVLAFCHKHGTVASGLQKILQTKAVYLKTKVVYENQVVDWILHYGETRRMKISPEAARLLAEHLGKDLGRIASELGKIRLNLGENEAVRPTHVQTYVGISREYNVFELQKAIGYKQVAQAHKIMGHMLYHLRQHPPWQTVAALSSYFGKLLLFHALRKTHLTDKALAAKMGVHVFFLKEYKVAIRNHSVVSVRRSLNALRSADAALKGLLSYSPEPKGVMRTLLYQVLR